MKIIHNALATILCLTVINTYADATRITCPCTHTAKGCQCLFKQTDSDEKCCCIEKTGSCACAEQNCCTPSPRSNAFVETGFGELVDKITILEIKTERIHDPKKLFHIATELDALNTALILIFENHPQSIEEIIALKEELHIVNATLWDVEDILRNKESLQSFDEEFIENARAVYINNDKRSALKATINSLLGSSIREEKSYSPY